jgi:glycosyltransferase involved in cell wall biosynthesis
VSRQRIAVVTTSYPEHSGDPSGHFVEAEVRALEKAGADVSVFALRGDAFGWPGVAAKLKQNPLRVFGAAKEVARVTSAISQNGLFSRVIAHWAIPCAWPIARACESVEIVSHGGDVRLLASLPGVVRARLVDRLLRNTTSWRFVSEPLKEDLLATLGADWRARLESIACVRAPDISFAVEPHAIEQARAEQRTLARGQNVFAVAARLVASKNVDRAILYAVKENSALLVIGDGPERARLERLAREVHANAHFLGVLSRPETLAHIAAADALVHMSEREGLSSVVREADALGTRVITRA